MKKKLLSMLLTVCLVAGLVPTTALAAGIENGQPALTVNQSKVAFAGREWWVIGDGTNGVYPQSGHITLLAANLDNEFKNVPFRSGQGIATDSYTKYQGLYYVNNPTGIAAWATPNEYAGSILQQKMESIANGFSPKEQAVISARNLASGATEDNNWSSGKADYIDGIAGPGVDKQKLWALSDAECNTINNTEVCKYDDWCWLRSPGNSGDQAALVNNYGSVNNNGSNVLLDYGTVRPALSLNLSSVLFTSAADASGKSSATAGGGLVEAEAATGTVKFTMLDDSQTLKLGKKVTQTGTTLSFSYSGATTGENQYVSCILTDDSGAVKYYGKLADSSSAASGNLSVPLAGVADGTYTLKIFSEQANGDLYTDFCSEPVSMKVAVSGKDVTVSGFDGEIHKHNWNENAWNSNNTHHWHECTAEDCPVTDNNQKEGFAEHTYNQAVATDQYLKSAANCDSPATYYYSCVCGAKGEKTFENGTAAGHDWGEPVWNWSDDGKTVAVTFTCKNDNTHTQSPKVEITSEVKTPATCTERGTTTYTAKATFDGQEYTSTKDVADIAKLSHTLKKTDKVEATCTTDGKETYYTCESCGKHFSDAEGKNEITKLEEYGIIPATEHKAGTEWKHNDTSHWNECMNNCGEKLNEAAHQFGGWTVTKEATKTEAGSRTKSCTVCGYEVTESIPATGTTEPTEPPKPTDPDKENPDTGSTSPQTGDNSNFALWVSLLFASGGALTAVTIYSRKRRKTE